MVHAADMGTASVFLIELLLGATALAFWLYIRFPRLTPGGSRAAIVHLILSAAAAHLLLPSLLDLVGPIDSRLSAVAVLAIALPALTYLMLASLWLLNLARQLLGGYR
jgi:hypothetical protein